MTRERFITEARACQGQLRRFLTSLCGDAALADDIAQEALVRAYVMADRFTGNFKAWLFRIAYNCFIDNLRRVPPPVVNLTVPEALHIAAIMDIPSGTVKYCLSMGRNHLKEHISL